MYWLLGTILSFIGPYDQGKPPINGVHIKYHRTGNPYRIALFLDGKQEFKEIRWYSDGSLWSVIDFSNGVYDGAHRSWYPNGKVRYLKYYKNGIRHGEEWGWHANGVLSDHHVFFDGKQVLYQSFISDGRPYSNYLVKDEERIGVQGADFCKTESTRKVSSSY